MKDLRRRLLSLGDKQRDNKPLASDTSKSVPAAQTADSGAVSDFLSKVAALPPVNAQGVGRVIFALDATASREATWDSAMQPLKALLSMISSVEGRESRCILVQFLKALSSIRVTPAGIVTLSIVPIP